MPPKRVSPRDKAVRLYTAALQDWSSPKYCGICLTGLICKIVPNADVYAEVLVSHHEFWDVSAAFLTHSRSTAEMENVVHRLSVCNCPVSDPYILDLHATSARCERTWRDNAGGSFAAGGESHAARARFPHLLISTVAHALEGAKIKSVAKGAKATWPKNITDVIPAGGETTVKAMILWHNVLDHDLVVFSLLEVMVRICQTLIMPHIAASALPGLMVSSGRALFDRTYVALDSPSINERRQSANTFFHQASPIDSFLLCVLRTGIGEVEFPRGTETKLVQLCNLMIHISTDPRLPSKRVGDARILLMGCTMWAGRSYRMFHMYLPPRPPILEDRPSCMHTSF